MDIRPDRTFKEGVTNDITNNLGYHKYQTDIDVVCSTFDLQDISKLNRYVIFHLGLGFAFIIFFTLGLYQNGRMFLLEDIWVPG